MADGYTVAYVIPRPTPQQLVERATVEVDPEPDERLEHIDSFGNRVLQLGVHHAAQLADACHATSRRRGRADDARRRRSGRGSRWPRPVTACRGGEALAVRPFAGGSADGHGGRRPRRLRDLVRASFIPGRPVDRRGAGALPRHLHVVRVRPGVDRRVDAARRRARTRAVACARTSPTLPSAGLRELGLAARYVSGYIETSPPPGRPRLSAPTRRTRGARCGCRRSAGSTSTRRTTSSPSAATSRWRGAATTAMSHPSGASSSAGTRCSACLSPSRSSAWGDRDVGLRSVGVH